VAKPTFSTPDLTTFCRLDTLDLTCTGQNITGHKAILECRPNTADDDGAHRKSPELLVDLPQVAGLG